MNITECRDRLVAISDEAQTIYGAAEKEDRDLTVEEATKLDEILAEVDTLKTEIKALERKAAVTDLGTYLDTASTRKVQPETPRNPNTPTEFYQPQAAPRIEMPGHHGGLRVYKDKKDLMDAYRIGRFFDAVFNGRQRSIQWCRENGVFGAHTEGVDSTGGVLVPEEMSNRIINLRDTYGVYRRNTYLEPMASASKTIPRRTGGLTAYHVGEGDTTTESTSAWDNITLTAHKVSILSKMSEELEEDSMINFADRLTMEAALAFAYREDLDGFTGDGTSGYGGATGVFPGILGLAGAVAVDTVGHDLFTELDSADLTKLMATLPAYARAAGPKWYMSSYAYDQTVGRLSLAGGGNTISNWAEGWTPTFMGYPVELSEVLPTTGAINEVGMLAFGTLSMASTMGDRRGITVKRDESVYFTTDEIGLKFTERYAIVNHDLGTASAAGPIVVLIGDTS